jgi:RimJ/RimL family protein N-acetyltransferase
MTIEIRLAELSDIVDLVDHDLRHFKEPGFQGQLAHPFPYNYEWNRDKMMDDKIQAWPKEITEEQWARSFIVLENGIIRGHLNLKNLFSGTLHRAQLGMGLEESIRGKGIGKELMKTAIQWARTQNTLHWLDLTVFAHNTPAINLYKTMGFSELYTIADRLRVEDVSIDDVYMVLNLKK